jgi:hypothetical protein
MAPPETSRLISKTPSQLEQIKFNFIMVCQDGLLSVNKKPHIFWHCHVCLPVYHRSLKLISFTSFPQSTGLVSNLPPCTSWTKRYQVSNYLLSEWTLQTQHMAKISPYPYYISQCCSHTSSMRPLDSLTSGYDIFGGNEQWSSMCHSKQCKITWKEVRF